MTDVVCVANWNADLVSRVPRPIARGETLESSHFEVTPGGKGSNAAIAAARQGAHPRRETGFVSALASISW